MYDEYGMEGIKQNMSADGMNASDIFSQFFGGRGGGNRRRRTDDIVREYPVDLKDLYKGKTAKFRITHKIICSACKGRGGEEGCEKPCQDCRGRGMRVRVIQRGNMIQQSQSPCSTCRGTGKIIDPSKCCKVCNGNKVVPETKTIEVDVEAGMMEGDKVILPSAADEAPGMEAGDVVYVIKEKGSNMFARKKGDLLHIEAVAVPGTGKLELTGSLGDVMKESAQAAITYIRAHASELSVEPDFYKKKDIHIHVPEGAVPKDGPSAGVTIATALASELSGRAVRRDVAMTGEITLHGKVLPIGGLREKAMAAYKTGVKTVLIPRSNLRDLEEIDPVVREKLNFIPCSRVSEVFGEALI